MQRHSKSIEPAIRNVEAMWNIDPQSIEAVARTCAAWFGQAKRMHDETLRFAQDRFQKELAAAVQLTKCTTPDEALALQAKFVNNMTEDYVAEGQRIAELMGRMVEEITATQKPNRSHH
jgi:hypothetical protein